MRKINFIKFTCFLSKEDADAEWRESWIEKQKGVNIKIKCMKICKYGVCEVIFYPFVHFFMTHNADNNHHLEKLSH